jgi:hypothetical protein
MSAVHFFGTHTLFGTRYDDELPRADILALPSHFVRKGSHTIGERFFTWSASRPSNDRISRPKSAVPCGGLMGVGIDAASSCPRGQRPRVARLPGRWYDSVGAPGIARRAGALLSNVICLQAIVPVMLDVQRAP